MTYIPPSLFCEGNNDMERELSNQLFLLCSLLHILILVLLKQERCKNTKIIATMIFSNRICILSSAGPKYYLQISEGYKQFLLFLNCHAKLLTQRALKVCTALAEESLLTLCKSTVPQQRLFIQKSLENPEILHLILQ